MVRTKKQTPVNSTRILTILVGALFVGLIITNILWYQFALGQDAVNRAHWSALQEHESDIRELQK